MNKNPARFLAFFSPMPVRVKSKWPAPMCLPPFEKDKNKKLFAILVDAGHRGHVINFINGCTRGGLKC